MSVYTSLSQSDTEAFLARFELGTLVSYKGITAGIENTNYFVTCQQQGRQSEYVLTLFEHHNSSEVREFVRLAHHLGQQGLQVPAPLAARDGEWLHSLKDKPAIICPRLPGEHIHDPQPQHCAAIGRALAELHLAALPLHNRRNDSRGFDWWLAISPELSSDLTREDQRLLEDELRFQTQQRSQWLSLPQGWIHGDLFHDNALFTADGQVGAILDLYNACDGALLYDLAIIANDWCCDINGDWKAGCTEALLNGYESVRPLNDAEKNNWNLVLRGAALRFWLSRLLTRRIQQQQAGEMALQKDPAEFMNKLKRQRGADDCQHLLSS
ncbi:homoserine kinase [Thalassolituus sp. ST750PaO-4]|uniref:homoserine kinase n=1 Tax=Thalassolituus sp. ST750PaO-4 TaxID=2742965 RepID=UPI001CE2D6A1|nr:homoserine kinase [Thalassolituus sp. ST750PaO-4]MCA6059150.1 homoserine kinase [Thalassolituus sp. ST750PaO-4]